MGGKADGAARPSLAHCTEGEMPGELDTVEWNHTSSGFIAATGEHHTARDVLTTEAAGGVIRGKFAYGPTSKDLEDERVEVWIDDCEGGYRIVGEAVTDGDGRTALEVDPEVLSGPGIYGVYQRVMGDDTRVHSTLRVFPTGTSIAIFDIDGTLTTDNLEGAKDVVAELFEPLGTGDYVPEARSSAAAITRLRQSQGYPIVYLTGRPYWLTDISREWLADLGFAPGSLMLAPSIADALPYEDGVGDYKAEYLEKLRSAGFVIELAYGNASTDIYGYAEAEVPTARTFIVGKHGGEGGSIDLGEGYDSHMRDASEEPPPEQPFTW